MNIISIFKSTILLFLFFTIGFNLYSESVYTYDIKKDIVLSSLSIGVFLTGFLLDDEQKIPNNLNRDDVNSFDRGLMYADNKSVNISRDIVRFVLPILPVVTPLAVVEWVDFNKDFNTWLTYGLMYMQTAALTYGTDMLINKPINRFRPSTYFVGNIDYPVDSNSFPSGTTAYAFMPATFFSVTFSAEFPDSKWKIPVIAGSYSLATVVGVLSIFSGKHFLTDVLAGAAMGTFYGWLIPALHKRTKNDDSFSFYVSGNGILVSLKY